MQGVLLVDDHAEFRAFARGLIISAGYLVIAEAADGSAALRAADLHHPEIVVLDIRLPDMSGLDVARRMKAGPNPPVVILISSGDRREYEQWHARPAHGASSPRRTSLRQRLRDLADRP